MNISMPASFCPPATMPNSAACLIEFVVSPPALASPMILALELCACSRKEEKSALLSGCLTPPSTLPPLAVTTAAVVRGEEEPAVATGFHQRLAGAVGEHP